MRQIDSSCRPYVRLDFLVASMTDPTRLDAALRRVEDLAEDAIRTTVATTPPQLLSAADQTVYADFLVARQRKLRDRFRQDWQAVLPNLQVPHGQR